MPALLRRNSAKEGHSPEEVSEAVADMGGSLDIGIGDEQSIVGMDVLAEKLVTWEPMNHEQRLTLLAKRTKPVGALSA